MSNNISVYNRRPSLLGRNVWEELFNNVFNDPSLVRRSTEGYPVTDIYRDQEGNSVIECALAGFSKDQLAIEVKDGRITITANSGEEEGDNRRIARRAFTRTYVDHSGKLDLANSEASFENGLLRITVPQVSEAQARVITIG